MSKSTNYTTVGGLLPRDFLDRVSAGDAGLPGLGPTSYGLAPGERLNDAITRSWNRLRGLWDGFVEAEADQPESDRTATAVTRERWLLPLLAELGFEGGIKSVRGLAIDDKTYAISHQWGGSVPIHLPGARLPIDRVSRGVQGAAASSPHGVVQEFLNRSEDHLWALLSNGLQLRLLRDNASLTRQAYVEFDLEAIFNGDSYADFVVLWLTCHRTRFEADIPEQCLLEQWSAEAASAGTRALDNLRSGVEAAITTLGEGFVSHPANNELREALRSGELPAAAFNHQLLRTVYRILFLLVAEHRGLLLDPEADQQTRSRYNDYYSITRVRTLATNRRGSVHGDLWHALRIVFDALAHDGQPALALRPLGSFLWSQEATLALNQSELDNAHLLQTMRHLGQVRDTEAKVVRSVDFRNLGAEELGSIYESLLELHPEVDIANRRFDLATAAGNERKTTGSYYTPTSLINELLDSALEPVLREAARKPDPEAAILDLSVLDPACGSGHFLIAAAHRIAHRLAAVRSEGSEPSPEQVRTALRDVVGRCLHGIDINPMAVELCKVSLWLEAMEPGKPLSFLEHRIVCGNALLGTTPRLLDGGVPDDAYPTARNKLLTGDDQEVAKRWQKTNKTERKKLVENQGALALDWNASASARPLAAAIDELDQLPDGTVEQIAVKQSLLDDLVSSDTSRSAKLAADAWCAAFVSRKLEDQPAITTGTVQQLIDQPSLAANEVIASVEGLAAQYQFLHLHLAFPDVIRVPDDPAQATNQRAGWSGGFDIVLGNPPWERVKLQEKEWFAARDPEIASAPNAATRKKLIANLETEAPELHQAFRDALRQAEGESHLLRTSGKYPLCGRGDVNTYTVFAEAMRDAIAPAGRVGVIVPSGIATDDTTRHFFRSIVESRNLVSLFEFENVGFFSAGHGHMVRFVLLTLAGTERPSGEIEMLFQGRDIADLANTDRRFSLSPEELDLLNPNTGTCPIFRTRRDAEITKGIYRRFPVLVREGATGNGGWNVEFSTMFHMSNDSALFRTRDQLVADGWTLQGNVFTRGLERRFPLYEGKMFGLWSHRHGSFPEGKRAHVLPKVADEQLENPASVGQPWYWVDAGVLDDRTGGSEYLCWRDTGDSRASARTMIACLVPITALSNKAPYVRTTGDLDIRILACVLSSFVCDYVVRQKVAGSTINYFYVKQLAIPSPGTFEGSLGSAIADIKTWMTDRVSELTYTSWDLVASWESRQAEGGGPFVRSVDRRAEMMAELDALAFHLYGIERKDVDYIMDTFPIVWRKDEEEHGEYRTKRLILEIYDEIARAIASGEPYETRLDPPPADPSLRHDPSTRPDWADLYLELAKGSDE